MANNNNRATSPTSDEETYCVRCDEEIFSDDEVCLREWQGDSDAKMCHYCWDQTEQEEEEEEEREWAEEEAKVAK